ncbi:hypothetical protein SAMN05421747_107157 [Parapedobacter composti]|uniref:Uncharacterized protein n=1 Tax=Parapedobacter composti TaxID=623281 RepID=A0A1I1HWJ3_9SPHI|nr:hypothetical protein SAMN05421747_107157 [Parapedobacter composti]
MLMPIQPKHIPDLVEEPLTGAFTLTSDPLQIRRIHS